MSENRLFGYTPRFVTLLAAQNLVRKQTLESKENKIARKHQKCTQRFSLRCLGVFASLHERACISEFTF